MDELKPTATNHIRKFGIEPIDKTPAAYKYCHTAEETFQTNVNVHTAITKVLIKNLNEIQRTLIQSQFVVKKHKKRHNVIPWKSIALAELQQLADASVAAWSSDSATSNLILDDNMDMESTNNEDTLCSEIDFDEDILVLSVFSVPDDHHGALPSHSKRQRNSVDCNDFI
jgi:hypothetical protein